jgi:hypothetical protein
MKGLALDSCPEATSSNVEMARQQRTPPGACFKWNQTRHWAKNCPSPLPPPGPCLWCGQSGHRRMTAPLCLCKVGQSPSHSQQSEGLTYLLGLVADDWHGPGTSAAFKIILEEPRVAVQVADRPQSPTWCYLTSQVSFILHRYPWWSGWSHPPAKKGKTILFN